MDSIDIYNNKACIIENKYIYSKYFVIILIIIFILLIIFSFIPFNIYKNYVGSVIIENNTSYIKIETNLSDFPINKNNKLYILKDKYNYEIIKIENNNVILKVNLKDNIRINNNISLLNILTNRTTLFDILKYKLKKGLCIWGN